MIDFHIPQWCQDDIKTILKACNQPEPPSGVFSVTPTSTNLPQLLLPARIHCISKDELYFLQSPQDILAPFNLRNEAAAVSLILQRLKGSSGTDIDELKQALLQHCESLWPEFATGDVNLSSGKVPPSATPCRVDSLEAAFHVWARDNGIKSELEIAYFDGLRGCAAVRDIDPGTPILSIPKSVLIYEETIRNTDLGKMLLAIPSVSVDNVLILFTMIDRHDPESYWAPFWSSLPTAFRTGLSFPPELLSSGLLQGTAAELEIKQGQSHLQAQYKATRPLMDMLLAAYPAHLDAAWFDYESYLWATELFYGYAFEIEFPNDDKSKTVMVPFACHVNHSPWPHVVRYGRVDETTDCLEYPAFRPCSQGQQAYISYGPVPNLKLLTYYGFVIPNNPHDVFSLTLGLEGVTLTEQQLQAMKELGLAVDHSLQKGPFARQMLADLRVIVATDTEMQQIQDASINPLEQLVSDENEAQAMNTLKEAINLVLDQIPDPEATIINAKKAIDVAGEEWQGAVEQCIEYVRGQRDILLYALSECDKKLLLTL